MAGLVGIIMGSASDSETMNYCVDILEQEGISFDYIVASAHRDPDAVKEWVEEAEQRGNKIIIAGAGMAAALPGVCAAYTDLPVIGVPMTSELNGMDSLLSISQMPKGVPVACMSIGKAGAINAAYLSKRILDLIGQDFYTKPWIGQTVDDEEFAPVTGAIDPDLDEELDQN